jgi:hypothetical protein
VLLCGGRGVCVWLMHARRATATAMHCPGLVHCYTPVKPHCGFPPSLHPRALDSLEP